MLRIARSLHPCYFISSNPRLYRRWWAYLIRCNHDNKADNSSTGRHSQAKRRFNMKPDHLNRIMRANGRLNPWFLRSTNELYDNAIKSYYDRGSSLLPYNPESRGGKKRQENRGPIRTLKAVERERGNGSVSNYPRNHHQMVTQANSNNLLDSVMQATRRRSISFGGSTAPSHSIYGPSLMSASSSSCSSAYQTDDSMNNNNNDGLELISFGARSLSSPPRAAITKLSGVSGLGRTHTLPSRKHHMNAFQKSSAAAANGRKRNDYDSEADQLMVVDKALKERLAVRFDRTPEGGDASTHFRFDASIDRRQFSRQPESYAMRNHRGLNDVKEQARFQPLGERIKRFEYIQFADGPVTSYAFNRRKQSNKNSTASEQKQQQSSQASRKVLVKKKNRTQKLARRSEKSVPAACPVEAQKGTQQSQGRNEFSDNMLHDSVNPNEQTRCIRPALWRNELHAVQQQQRLLKIQLLREHRQHEQQQLQQRKQIDSHLYAATQNLASVKQRMPEPLPPVATMPPSSQSPQLHQKSHQQPSTFSMATTSSSLSESATALLSASPPQATASGVNLRPSAGAQNYLSVSSAQIRPRTIIPYDIPKPSKLVKALHKPYELIQPKNKGSRNNVSVSISMPFKKGDMHGNMEKKATKTSMIATKKTPKLGSAKACFQSTSNCLVPETVNGLSRSSHQAYLKHNSERNVPPQLPPQRRTKQQNQAGKPQGTQKHSKPVQASVPKNTNQLLVNSANKVSAYKRAFKTQQQILKAEQLCQQGHQMHQSGEPQPIIGSQRLKTMGTPGCTTNINLSNNPSIISQTIASCPKTSIMNKTMTTQVSGMANKAVSAHCTSGSNATARKYIPVKAAGSKNRLNSLTNKNNKISIKIAPLQPPHASAITPPPNIGKQATQHGNQLSVSKLSQKSSLPKTLKNNDKQSPLKDQSEPQPLQKNPTKAARQLKLQKHHQNQQHHRNQTPLFSHAGAGASQVRRELHRNNADAKLELTLQRQRRQLHDHCRWRSG